MAQSLNGQCIVIIGDSDEIGLMLVENAAGQGANVIFSGPPDNCGIIQPYSQNNFSHGRVSCIPGLLTTENEIEQIFSAIINLDVIISSVIINIALPRHRTSLVDLSLEQWQHTLNAGTRLPFWITKTVISEFLYNGQGGRLVFFVKHSDVLFADFAQSASCTALQGLSRSIAKEYGSRHIASNVVFWKNSSVSSVEIALFLAGSDASFINGEVINVDG